jgi:hypothetical protein
MTGLIQHHRGWVVDAPGDNVLTEFVSVVDAVECAVEIQKKLKTRDAELPENRKMEFRMGVNLGDVIEDGEVVQRGEANRGNRNIKLGASAKKDVLIRLSEYLEVVEKKDGMKMICCVKCGNEFCAPGDNYKKYALRRTRDLGELKKVTEGEKPITCYQQYICPGCGPCFK